MERLYCWQGRTSEIEFLVESENEIVPWEVKSGRITHSKSLTVYEERYQTKTFFVLSAANFQQKGTRSLAPIYPAGSLARRLGDRSISILKSKPIVDILPQPELYYPLIKSGGLDPSGLD